MMKFIFFIFHFTLLISVFGKKYLCSLNETIKLEKNELIFFESYAFPHQIMGTHPCVLNISNSNPQINEKLYVVYNSIYFFEGEYFFLTNFLIFDKEYNTDSLAKNKTKAVQGFAVSEDITEGCPLESISKDGPFELSDETEIIHLRSTYFQNQSRKFPCLWKFNSTIQYGFKIVFTNLTISSNTTLIVRNSTDAYIGNGMISLNHAYYNDDNYIEISLSLGDPSFIPDLEFPAYISVVKKHYEIVDANCVLRYDGPKNESLWWYTNRYYPSNSRCSFDLVIQPNTAVLIGYEWSISEQNVDYIRYNIEGEGWIIFDGINFNIEGYKNESTKNVWFEFVSDGSLQFWGFQLEFHEIHCECANSVIQCDPRAPNLGIMTTSSSYCSHMHCNFFFEPCYGPYLKIHVIIYSGDVFIFKSNNETVLEINYENQNQDAFGVYFNPGSVSTMEASTLSGQVGSFSMQYQFQAFPHTKTFTLSNDNINVDIYANNDDIFLIKMSDDLASQNLSIIVYITKNIDTQVFNNESLTFNIASANCIQGSSLYKCTVNSNQLAIKSFDYSGEMSISNRFPNFIAVRLSKRRKGCILEENIFVASDDTHSIVGIADSEGECMIRLLIAFDEYQGFLEYLITYLWTTAKNDTVKIYVGSDTSNLLFQFNKETMTQWGNIGLFSAVYTIIIPKKSSLLMTIKKYTYLISMYPLINSVIATKFFGTLQITADIFYEKPEYHPYCFASYDSWNFPIQLTVIYYNMPPKDQFYFCVDGYPKCVTMETGYSIVLKHNPQSKSRIMLCYNRVEVSDGSNGILFFAESVPANVAPMNLTEYACSELLGTACASNQH